MTDGRDLKDNLVEKVKPELVTRGRRDFKSWHLPRKQFVREDQWKAESERLIREQRLSEFRYLTLPGEDFLDVRVLANTCAEAGARIRFLGFDSTAPKGLDEDISSHEVGSLQGVDKFSQVVRDRLEKIGKPDTRAYSLARAVAPFDAVNLDLCDSIADSSTAEYFEAIRSLCRIQLQTSTRAWLLFLTSRTDRGSVDRTLLAKLLDCICDNAAKWPNFARALETELGMNPQQLLRERDESERLPESLFGSALTLGVGKWLLALNSVSAPAVEVTLRSSYRYSTKRTPDMVSAVFQFRPVVQQADDRTMITRARPATSLSEPELAQDLVAAVSNEVDLDLFIENQGLWERLRDQAAALLETARYERAEFLTWADRWRDQRLHGTTP